jgi:hypothetical protein
MEMENGLTNIVCPVCEKTYENYLLFYEHLDNCLEKYTEPPKKKIKNEIKEEPHEQIEEKILVFHYPCVQCKQHFKIQKLFHCSEVNFFL